MSDEFTDRCELCRHPALLWRIEIRGRYVWACEECCQAHEPQNEDANQ